MSNITYIYFEKFEKGCELSISIAEYQTGPFTKGKIENYLH